MGPQSAFVSAIFGLPLASNARALGCRSSNRTQIRVHRHRTMRWQMAEQSGDAQSINFDEIAKRLAGELQGLDPSAKTQMIDETVTKNGKVVPFELSEGNGGITRIIMRHGASRQEVEIYTYGACVTSWKVRDDENLWMSDTNKWISGGKAIRGGIPLCFPQFGPYGNLVQHGFARISDWSIYDTVLNKDGSLSTILTLDNTCDNEEVKKWPYKFSAEYTVTLSPIGLEAKLSVTNTGEEAMPFTCAFHNYFKTTKASDARIFGVENSRFNDRLDGDRENPASKDDGAGLLLSKETDRVYLNAPDELAMFDFSTLKVLKIKKTPTMPNATVWNPFGADGCDPGWEKFICIEPAAVSPGAVVQPGETWIGAQLLGVE